MRRLWIVCFGMSLAGFAALPPLCNGSDRPKTLCAGWESLQQLRDLIPERIWEQEFRVSVARGAFRKAASRWMQPQRKECAILGHSHGYFLRSTLSGAMVRIEDQYQEFQGSPFWKNPPMLQKLVMQERELMREGR